MAASEARRSEGGAAVESDCRLSMKSPTVAVQAVPSAEAGDDSDQSGVRVQS